MNDTDKNVKSASDAPGAADEVSGPAIASATVDFARLGLNQIAYVRRVIVDDVPVWSIHAATGDTIGAAQTFEQAWGAIKQNNLEPLRLH